MHSGLTGRELERVAVKPKTLPIIDGAVIRISTTV
jgi:hypothetical protein